ncbi:hypothetical protein O0L34_g5363 [Tuta absoluta]|nr:hypothetical protein O0L34_g5363 [Tuta absoluta]
MSATLRKFGMRYTDLPTMLWNVTTLLKLLALDIDPKNENGICFIFYFFLIFISVGYYYTYLVSMIWFVFVRCRETGDLISAAVVFSLGINSEVSLTKLWCLFAQRHKIRKLINAFLAFDEQVLPNTRFAKHVEGTLRAVKKRALIIWYVIMVDGFIYCITPFFIAIFSERRLLENSFEFIGFGNMTTMKTTPSYEIAYSINCVAVFVTCYPSASISVFYIIISGYIEAQMLALAQELTSVWVDAVKYNENNSSRIIKYFNDFETPVQTQNGKILITAYLNNEDTSRTINITKSSTTNTCYSTLNSCLSFTEKDTYVKKQNAYVRRRLTEIMKGHTTCMSLLQQVEEVFKIGIAFEFIFIGMGLTADLLGDLAKTYIQLPFVLLTVTIDCLAGQRIKNACSVFEKAVYDSKWENFDVTNRKIILLMLRSSQKELKLTAGGYAALTTECLMGVLKTTYSAYTTLRSTVKR